MARNTLQSESASVTPLPTAAPRKVRQLRSRTSKADWEALLPFTREHLTPFERSARKKAEELLSLEMTVEMALAVAMFQTLDNMDQIKVQLFLALLVEKQPSAALALTYTEFVTCPENERGEIARQLRRLQGRA